MPVKLKRCGLEKRFIISDNDTSNAYPQTVQAIQKALSKALGWNQAIVSGITSSMTALAKQENVTQRYITHLIKLTFLAPNIIEAIKHGDIPAALSLDRLKKGFPFDWNAQRKLLGFKH